MAVRLAGPRAGTGTAQRISGEDAPSQQVVVNMVLGVGVPPRILRLYVDQIGVGLKRRPDIAQTSLGRVGGRALGASRAW
jgi:hypothetical protein